MKKQTLLPVLLLAVCWACCISMAVAQGSGTKAELVTYYHNSGVNGALPALQGDIIGTLKFNALTGTNSIITGASIRTTVTGLVSPGILPCNLVFRTGGSGLLDRMVITEAGLVGIGTLNPTFNLHTVGNTHTTGDFYGRIHMDDNQTTDAAPNTYNDEAYLELKQRSVLSVPGVGGTQGGLFTLAPGGTSDDHQLFFGDDGIYHRRWAGNASSWAGSVWYKILTGEDINGTKNRIAKFTDVSKLGDSRLFDDGTRVGINNFAPAYDLDINGTTHISGSAFISTRLGVGNTAPAEALDVTGNATVSGNSYTGGNLGVGTTAPTQKLDVKGVSLLDGNAFITGNLGINNTAPAYRLHVNGDGYINGKMAIGPTDQFANGYLLSVGGKMIAEEMRVALHGTWPDYVFDPKSPAPDPLVWERYILTHHHLPGLPSAQEVSAAGGVDVGETQRMLLEKVEQLTLIVIEQQKQIEALKVGRKSRKH
jgi:hypothetical protein